MRVLIVSQIFAPETGALANRMAPLVRELIAAGHEVRVATGLPNYPEGVVFPPYRGKWFVREKIDGAAVLRTAYYTVPRNQSKLGQLGSYLSFIPAVWHSGLRGGPADVVFVTSPPIFPAIAAVGLARLWRVPLVFDIRDLWPDELIACGAAREGSLPVRFIRAIERWVYRTANRVTCTTQAFMDVVIERGVARENAVLLPNGADLELFRPLPRDNPVAAELGLGERFVVFYSGLLGIKHGLESVLEAAAILKDQKDIVFVLVGSGARKRALMQAAAEQGLENVLFLGDRSVDQIPYLIARADVCVSSLLPAPYLEKIISVKIFEYLACEKPVVAAQGGESARVLRESGGGIVVRPGDGRAMAEAIRRIHAEPARGREMGQVGRRYVETHYSRAAGARLLEQILREMCEVRQNAADSSPARKAESGALPSGERPAGELPVGDGATPTPLPLEREGASLT